MKDKKPQVDEMKIREKIKAAKEAAVNIGMKLELTKEAKAEMCKREKTVARFNNTMTLVKGLREMIDSQAQVVEAMKYAASFDTRGLTAAQKKMTNRAAMLCMKSIERLDRYSTKLEKVVDKVVAQSSKEFPTL